MEILMRIPTELYPRTPIHLCLFVKKNYFNVSINISPIMIDGATFGRRALIIALCMPWIQICPSLGEFLSMTLTTRRHSMR